MAGKIRIGLLLVLGLLVVAVSVWSLRFMRAEPPPAAPGYALEFRFEGPNPAHYSTIALDGEVKDPVQAVQQMLTQIPGEPNLVAILSSNDGKVREEWRWLNKAWTHTPKN